jgi:hypothetical protein
MQAVGGLCPWQKSCGVEWRLLPEHMFPSQKLGPPRVLGGFSGEDWVRMDPVCSRASEATWRLLWGGLGKDGPSVFQGPPSPSGGG